MSPLVFCLQQTEAVVENLQLCWGLDLLPSEFDEEEVLPKYSRGFPILDNKERLRRQERL